MNKLGFVLQVISSGADNVVECNGGSWTKNVVDRRLDLNLFSGLRESGQTVTSMQFSQFGCYIMTQRGIDGRAGDCICGWLFIPYGLDITDDEVMHSYNYVKNIVGMSSIRDVEDDIKSFFDKPYSDKSVKFFYSPSSGEKYGLRYYEGDEGLKRIIGKNRYQTYYSQYKVIFLLDINSSVRVNNEGVSRFADISNFRIDEYCVLMPPTREVLSLMGRGASVIFPNGQPFDTPLPVTSGASVELIVRRKGFENVILKPITVRQAEETFPPIANIVWKKRIGRNFFNVVNEDGEPISGYKIIVNGKDITMSNVELTESECTNARVRVKANGYEEYDESVNLLNRVSQVPITLHKANREVVYSVQLSNGKYADMTLSSKYLDDDSKSPLEGYSLNGDHKLSVGSRHKIKYFLCGVAATIIVWVIVQACISFGNWWNTHEFQLGWPPVKDIQKDSVDADSEFGESSVTPEDAAAIRYMDRETQWRKDSLSHYELTKDLYDLLNNYDFQGLLDKQIDGSSQYDAIKEVANRANNLKVSIDENYSEDGTITIDKWIKKVEQKIDSASSESYTPVETVDKNITDDGEKRGNSREETSRTTQREQIKHPDKKPKSNPPTETNKNGKGKQGTSNEASQDKL